MALVNCGVTFERRKASQCLTDIRWAIRLEGSHCLC